MSTPLRIPICDRCALALWPPRTLCPRCGGGAWHEGDGSRGRAEQTTDLTGAGAPRLATVRLDAGPVVIARAPGVAAGDRVTLSLDAGALQADPDPGSHDRG